MSSSNRGREESPQPGKETKPASSPPAQPGADPYANWLERMQRARARHAAITKNLYTWASYKSWADRMRDAWNEEKTEQKPK